MNIFKQFYGTIRPSASRFPASLILSIAATTLWSMVVYGCGFSKQVDQLLKNYTLYLMFGFFLSILIELAAEKILSRRNIQENKRRLMLWGLQAFSVILVFFPISFIYKNMENVLPEVSYWGFVLALIAGIFYLLKDVHGENKLVPAILISFVIAFIASLCIGSGLTVVALAILKLIFKNTINGSYEIIEIIWIATGLIFNLQIFLAYITKKDFEIPRFFKVLVHYILFPIYTILLAVLYIHLIQSLVTASMPHMNWFVSAATSLWILFYFSLKPYKNKVTSFFYKWGHFFLYPLLAIQILNFIERIDSYGFTASRVASLYYIILSTVTLLLPLYKNGKHVSKSMPLLMVFLIAGSTGPFSAVWMSVRTQEKRIESILERNGLIENGIIKTEKTSEVLSNEEKKTIYEAAEYFDVNRICRDKSYRNLFKLNPYGRITTESNVNHPSEIYVDDVLLKNEKETVFHHIFGFYKYVETEEKIKNCLYMHIESDNTGEEKLDVSSFKEMHTLINKDFYEKNGRFYISIEHNETDITEFVQQHLKNPDGNNHKPEFIGPLWVKAGGFSFYIKSIECSNFNYYSFDLMDEWTTSIYGYAFK